MFGNVKDLSFKEKEKYPVLKGIDLNIYENEFLTLLDLVDAERQHFLEF